MSQIHIEFLDVGDELGTAECPECCDALMDACRMGFRCGDCGSFVTYDSSRVVTRVHIT
ncbi:hypothetical protein [Streptomyces sp. KN37]|uniref:hypothetical protein n=1 Tax=Streptomyces sp. KN37 TaxID=3090667 RepID=UPI002A75D538|nr:hypothetical protein [Streptomyces sp. KN37]WPO70224.1 hypothetical protein R9806_06065 [Streptomyces sp. KN37]